MYPSDTTHTEELNEIIRLNKPMTEDIVKEMIEAHESAAVMDDGHRYYMGENDIQNRVIYTYQNDRPVEDKDAKNNKVSSGFHKLLVDQKVAYLAGKPVTVGSKGDDSELLEVVTDTLSDDFEDIIPELIKNVSNKGREWLHPYIDADGIFDYIRIPKEEVIPIYDRSKQKKLLYIIRFYAVDDTTTKVEMWDKEQVTFYEIIDGDIFFDVSEDINPASHFYYNGSGYGWGEVPFIEFMNNEERVGDLTFYKGYIDAYDLIVSDTLNTLEDMQSLIYILKGYEGTDLKGFNANLKRFKAIKVSGEDGSGVDTKQSEVPVNAVDSQLDRYTKNIFHFGQGADVSMDKFGNAPSGVALRQLFQLLDMKASVMERKFTKGLKHFAWFLVEYINITEKKDHDYKDLTFTFNKSMLTNEAEQIEMGQNSVGNVSKETILENHPWVKDVELEMRRLEEEAIRFGESLPPLNEDDEPNGGNKSSSAQEQTNSNDGFPCPECNGDGKITSPATAKQIQCPSCKGTGVRKR